MRKNILFAALLGTLVTSLILRDLSFRADSESRRQIADGQPVQVQIKTEGNRYDNPDPFLRIFDGGGARQNIAVPDCSRDECIDLSSPVAAANDLATSICDPIPGRRDSCRPDSTRTPEEKERDFEKQFSGGILSGDVPVPLQMNSVGALIVLLYCKATPADDWMPCADTNQMNPGADGNNLTKVFMGELPSDGTRFLIAPVRTTEK